MRVVSVQCDRSQLHWLVGANPWSKHIPKDTQLHGLSAKWHFAVGQHGVQWQMIPDTVDTKIQLQILQEKSSPKKNMHQAGTKHLQTFQTFQAFQASPLNSTPIPSVGCLCGSATFGSPINKPNSLAAAMGDILRMKNRCRFSTRVAGTKVTLQLRDFNVSMNIPKWPNGS